MMHGIAITSLQVARRQSVNGYCGESLIINFTIFISSRLMANLLAVNHALTSDGSMFDTEEKSATFWLEVSSVNVTASDKVFILDEIRLSNTMKSRGPVIHPWKFCVLLFCSLRKTFWAPLGDFIYSFVFCGIETEPMCSCSLKAIKI